MRRSLLLPVFALLVLSIGMVFPMACGNKNNPTSPPPAPTVTPTFTPPCSIGTSPTCTPTFTHISCPLPLQAGSTLVGPNLLASSSGYLLATQINMPSYGGGGKHLGLFEQRLRPGERGHLFGQWRPRQPSDTRDSPTCRQRLEHPFHSDGFTQFGDLLVGVPGAEFN
jgi:hypothetical protein